MARKFLSTLALLGLPLIALGQSVTLSIGSGTATPGGTIDLPITLASTGGAQTASLQWSFSFSSDITGVTAVAGASATNAGKSISCSANNCLLVGFNSNVMADGTVAVATFQIAANPSSNPISVQLTSVVASTAGGTSIAATGGSGAISLPLAAAALSTVSCTSSTINTPGSTPCSVTLTSAASAGGFAVSLSSNNASLTVPASVTVASGQTTGSFTATGAQVGSNQTAIVTATAGAVTRTATLNLVAPPQPSSLACAPSSLGSSASSTCTVTLNKVAPSAAVVSLSSNNGLLTVPANVTVLSGQTTATFTATSGSVSSNQSAIVTATLNGQSQQATISLVTLAQLSSLSCSPATVNAPGTSTCTATLTAAAASAVSVALSSNNASITVPASVSIGAGLSSATFTASVGSIVSDQSALLTATLNAASKTFTLTGSAPAQLTSLACAPSTLGSNASSTCTATLNKAASGATVVSLSSSNGLLTVPASVTVPSGQSAAAFTATSGSVSSNQSATVTAALNGQSQAATISLTAAVQLSSLACSPATVNAPGTSTCTIALTGATSGAVSVTLLSNNTAVTVPASVNIAAGLSSAAFTATVAAVVSNQSALLTATLNGISQAFTLTAAAPAQLTSLACAPSTLNSNASSTCTVALNTTTIGGTTVSLSSGSGLLIVPANVTILAGQSSATFSAAAGNVSSSQNVTVTATLNGLSQQATIALIGAAVQLSSLSCSPAAVNAPGSATCTATLAGAAPSSVSVTLASNNTSVTVPSSVTIGAGLSSATFTATVAAVASNQAALLTATLNGVAQTFTLTANANLASQVTSLACAPSVLSSNGSGACTVALNTATTAAATILLSSNTPVLSVPASITVLAGQSTATFAATAGVTGSSQNATITATFGGGSRTAAITVVPSFAPNCQEFRTTPEGLCTIQDLLPWVTFGGGWESRLKVGNIPSGSAGGTIQIGFTLLPTAPASGGVQNHMPAFFRDNRTGQMQVGESGTYVVALGESVSVEFLSAPGGCNTHGLLCWGSPDPSVTSYGSVLVKYVADNPAYLRGIAKAQLTFLANATDGSYGWQISERETPPANLWTAPVAVSANQGANPQTNQDASAALANPGSEAITVRGTLYNENGIPVTSRDVQIPSLGVVPLVFSREPNQSFGGFGSAMFPLGQDFKGVVTFQVLSPSSAKVSAMVLQYVGNAMSSVELNSQPATGLSVSKATSANCAEFAAAADGTCTVQYSLPWVVFGAGWESRLKAGNSPGSGSASAVQLRFTLVPASPATNGTQNHLPAFFSDGRSAQLRTAESASYTLNAGQSVDVHFLYPPAGCDSHGQNCSDQPDPGSLSYGSVLVQYSSSDPAALRKVARPQLAFLARPDGGSYAAQMTEHSATAANTWTAPVAISANQGTHPQTNEEAAAAIANQGTTPVTVRGTLRDRNGTAVASRDFQIPASGTIGIVFSQDASEPFGGFGNAILAQGRDFDGWVTFAVTSPSDGGVTVLVLQYVGDTMSSVNVQSF